MSCQDCNKKITRECLTCYICKNNFHQECTNVSIQRFRLMTAENRKNWKCKNCVGKKIRVINKNTKSQPNTSSTKTSPNTNVTLRRKPTSTMSFSSPSDSIDTITDTSIPTTSDTLLNRSCPENSIHIWDEIEDLKSKILLLETKLESADNEIESLLNENYALKNIISKRDAKINTLTRICQSTPTSCSKKVTMIPEKHRKRSPIQKIEILSNDSTSSSIPIQDLETSPVEIKSKASLASNCHLPTNKSKVIQTQNKKTSATVVQQRRICLISANKYNKTKEIAMSNLQGKICHYLMPNSGLKRLIEGIDTKLANFTMNDYCVILIGEEDFKTTTDYFELITCLRETLKKIYNTNILICLPTYKCCKFMDLFNWRVEIFNNLLYFDIMTHEYAFLIDSNRDLKYNNTMFSSRFGTLNNYGLNVIFRNVNCTMYEFKTPDLNIQQNVSHIQEQKHPQSEIDVASTKVGKFFRHPSV